MQVCDFARSFATFTTRGRGNNARIQVEAICDLSSADKRTRYVLVASCKSEDTYAEDNLFRQPNYDFCAIFSDTQYDIVRLHLPLSDAWRDPGLIAGRFHGVSINLRLVQASVCTDARQIVTATLDNAPLVGITELTDEATGMSARLEYPIKTMNVNDLRWVWQVDTGPVIVPDFRREVSLGIQCLDLAFVAYNCPDRAEFVLLRPTPVGGAVAGHYSEVRKLAAHNTIVRL